MDENLTTPLPPSHQCVELKCEYCASNCCGEEVSCMYTTPPTVLPTSCPLNKW
jgi:hypothetical protein